MGLQINTIITLENAEKYVVLNETMYNNKKYFLVMGIDEKKEVISSKVAILEEVIENTAIYVIKVEDQELIVTLTKLLKAQL